MKDGTTGNRFGSFENVWMYCVSTHSKRSQRRKLDKKAEKYRFVGYGTTAKGYRLFDDQSRQVVVRRDVVFNEDDFGNTSQSHKELEETPTLQQSLGRREQS